MTEERRQTFNAYGRRPVPIKKNARLPDRYQALVDGSLTIDDLDDEEILRGQMRNVQGRFGGGPPQAIPWVLHEALRAALTRRMERKLMEALPKALDSLVGIANNKWASADARVKAINLILERTLGKVPDKQEVRNTTTLRWEAAAEAGRLFVDLEPIPDPPLEVEGVVDAEVVEPKPSRAKTGLRL